jgi:hypothetical protein
MTCDVGLRCAVVLWAAGAYEVLGDPKTRRAYDRGENVDSKFKWQEGATPPR